MHSTRKKLVIRHWHILCDGSFCLCYKDSAQPLCLNKHPPPNTKTPIVCHVRPHKSQYILPHPGLQQNPRHHRLEVDVSESRRKAICTKPGPAYPAAQQEKRPQPRQAVRIMSTDTGSGDCEEVVLKRKRKTVGTMGLRALLARAAP